MAINGRINTNETNTPRCRFCGTLGHTLAVCPTMKEMYEKTKHLDYSERSYLENYAAQYLDKKIERKKAATKKPKKCGYCRETGHSRRACPTMIKDREKLIKGNKLWRRIWADKSKKFGLTPASLLKVTSRRYDYNKGGYENVEFLCTVGAELPENLTIFALGEDNRQQEVKIPMIGYQSYYGNSNTINARSLVSLFDETLSRWMFSYSYGSSSLSSIELIAPSSYEYSQEWLDMSPDEDIDFALKKWTQDQMSRLLGKVDKLINVYGADYGIQ